MHQLVRLLLLAIALAAPSAASAQLNITLLSTSNITASDIAPGATCTFGGWRLTSTPTVGSPTSKDFCYPGNTGPTGATGNTGATGSAGASVTRAAIAVGGACGAKTGVAYTLSGVTTNVCSGLDGSNGTNGATGAAGATGPAGAVGATGATGPQGPAGNGVVLAGTSGAQPNITILAREPYYWDATSAAYWHVQWPSATLDPDTSQTWFTTNTCTGTQIANAFVPPGIGYSNVAMPGTYFVPRAATATPAHCYLWSGGVCQLDYCPASAVSVDVVSLPTVGYSGPLTLSR